MINIRGINYYTTEDIVSIFKEKYANNDFRHNKNAAQQSKFIELQNISFIADKEFLLREPNQKYLKQELDWYLSQSLYVKDISENPPKQWLACADKDGKINSNYGWMIFSKENGNQYDWCLSRLLHDESTRQACMIYNRPSMQEDSIKNGMMDFCCTYAVQCFINNNELDYIVYMRSNDAVFGYNNDYAWHKYVRDKLVNDLNTLRITDNKIKPGHIFWNAGSLHVYERHFDYLK